MSRKKRRKGGEERERGRRRRRRRERCCGNKDGYEHLQNRLMQLFLLGVFKEIISLWLSRGGEGGGEGGGGGGVREGSGGKGANIDRFGLKVHDNYHELL